MARFVRRPFKATDALAPAKPKGKYEPKRLTIQRGYVFMYGRERRLCCLFFDVADLLLWAGCGRRAAAAVGGTCSFVVLTDRVRQYGKPADKKPSRYMWLRQVSSRPFVCHVEARADCPAQWCSNCRFRGVRNQPRHAGALQGSVVHQVSECAREAGHVCVHVPIAKVFSRACQGVRQQRVDRYGRRDRC